MCRKNNSLSFDLASSRVGPLMELKPKEAFWGAERLDLAGDSSIPHSLPSQSQLFSIVVLTEYYTQHFDGYIIFLAGEEKSDGSTESLEISCTLIGSNVGIVGALEYL